VIIWFSEATWCQATDHLGAGVNGHNQKFVMRVSQEQGMRSRSQPDRDTTHTRRTTHASQHKYTIRHSRPHTRVGL